MSKFGEGRAIIPPKLTMSDQPASPTNEQLKKWSSLDGIVGQLADECVRLRKENEHLKKISLDGWETQRLAAKQIRERLEAAKAFIDCVREDFENDDEPLYGEGRNRDKERDLLTAFDETWKKKSENKHMIEMLMNQASRFCWTDDPEWAGADDYAGGHIDDAFEGGTEAGATMLARKLIRLSFPQAVPEMESKIKEAIAAQSQ